MQTEFQQLKSDLDEVRKRLFSAIASVTEEQFKRRPPAGPEHATQWSIAEVLAHLLSQEQLRCQRIATALDTDGATITPSPPEMHDEAARRGRTVPVPQLIHGLLASRREIERLLDRAQELDGALEPAVVHPSLGRQTVGFMLREKIIDHEAEHVAQIERIKEALDMTGSPKTMQD